MTTIKVNEHYEVFDGNKFICSADTMAEAEHESEETEMEIARGTLANGTKFIITKLDGYYAIWFGDDFDKAEYTGGSTAGTLEQIMDELKEVM